MQQHQPTAACVSSSGIIQLPPTPDCDNVQAASIPSNFDVKRFKKQCLGLVLIGVLALIANVIAVLSGDPLAKFGVGFVCGTPIIISGVLGITVFKNRCLNMQIVRLSLKRCSMLAATLFVVSLAGIFINQVIVIHDTDVSNAIEALLALLGVAAFVLCRRGMAQIQSSAVIPAVPVLDQQPTTIQNENPHIITVSTLPMPRVPPVLDQPIPSGCSPAQHHHINSGPCAPSSPISSRDCQPEPAGPPPSYAELYGQIP